MCTRLGELASALVLLPKHKNKIYQNRYFDSMSTSSVPTALIFLPYIPPHQGFFSRLGKNTGRQREIRFSKIPEILAKIQVNTDQNLSNEVLKLVQNLSNFIKFKHIL
jgi:hypothetical protein